MNAAHHYRVSVWPGKGVDMLKKYGGLRMSPQRAKGAGRWWAREQM